MPFRKRAAFTLIETIAALSISGLVTLGGVLLMHQVSDSSERIIRSGFLTTRDGNAARVLRQLLFDAHVTADSLDRFRGDARSADFTSSCQHAAGWVEQCRVSLTVDWRTDSSVLIASTSIGDHLELARIAGRSELRYFDALSADSAWVSTWARSIAMPVAVGIIAGTDTIIFPLGSTR
jgi:type II secretory pathway component PulJ